MNNKLISDIVSVCVVGFLQIVYICNDYAERGISEIYFLVEFFNSLRVGSTVFYACKRISVSKRVYICRILSNLRISVGKYACESAVSRAVL